MRTGIGIIFGYSGFPMSDGALYAVKQAQKIIFKPGWLKKIMNTKALRKSVAEITHATQKK